tara:strand:- start:211 stop:714 length:504 start_codon:yes stop_codon:yes gene_type:complete
MANITYYSLSDYVGSTLISKTFQLDEVDHDEHLQQISDWLKSITKLKNDGEIREEWIVCDSEDIPTNYVGEYQLNPEFFEYRDVLNRSYLDKEIFEAGLNNGLTLEDIEENYLGYFRDPKELGEHFVHELGAIDIPEHLANYFDYESYGYDQSINNLSECDGHYFWN